VIYCPLGPGSDAPKAATAAATNGPPTPDAAAASAAALVTTSSTARAILGRVADRKESGIAEQSHSETSAGVIVPDVSM